MYICPQTSQYIWLCSLTLPNEMLFVIPTYGLALEYKQISAIKPNIGYITWYEI